jgi:hypothetical protein
MLHLVRLLVLVLLWLVRPPNSLYTQHLALLLVLVLPSLALLLGLMLLSSMRRVALLAPVLAL